MNMFAKKFGIALLTAATAFTPLTTGIANAGEAEFRDPYQPHLYRSQTQRWDKSNRGHRSHRGHRSQRRHYDNSDSIALGILGLGAAAIIGGAIANSNNSRQIYQQPSAPRAVSGGRYEPWSRSWFQYCSNKFRSFNASTGTYRGYDGRDHFCVAR